MVLQLVRLVLDKKSGTVYYKNLESVLTLDCVAGAAAGIKGSIKTLDDLLEMPNLKTVNLRVIILLEIMLTTVWMVMILNGS